MVLWPRTATLRRLQHPTPEFGSRIPWSFVAFWRAWGWLFAARFTEITLSTARFSRFAKAAIWLAWLFRTKWKSLFHDALELFTLFGCEDGFDLLVDAVHLLAHLRLKLGAHLPDAFLTFNH